MLTTHTPQPASLRMGGGKKRRRMLDHGLARGSVSFTKRIIQDDHNKFVRVITPLKKRQKREAASSLDLTESQIEKKNDLKEKRILMASPSHHL